jgi:S-formylglutathione hydrolase FrmB
MYFMENLPFLYNIRYDTIKHHKGGIFVANISATFRSEALGTTTHARIIFPLTPPEGTVTKRVLYLLHGMTGGCDDWVSNTRIAHYANQQQFIVIMPEVQNSFYTDMAYGGDYFTYVAYELPALAEQIFNIRHTRENTYIAGLSMGGYGAAKIALSRPDFFTAVAAFSGALDTEWVLKTLPTQDDRHKKLAIAIAGLDLQVPEGGNLFTLATGLAQKPEKPRILVTCGTEDFLLDSNRAFDAHMKPLPFEYTYKEWAGTHDWDFWEESLPLMFDFFNKKGVFA